MEVRHRSSRAGTLGEPAAPDGSTRFADAPLAEPAQAVSAHSGDDPLAPVATGASLALNVGVSFQDAPDATSLSPDNTPTSVSKESTASGRIRDIRRISLIRFSASVGVLPNRCGAAA